MELEFEESASSIRVRLLFKCGFYTRLLFNLSAASHNIGRFHHMILPKLGFVGRLFISFQKYACCWTKCERFSSYEAIFVTFGNWPVIKGLKEKFGLFVDFEFLTEMGSWGTD